MGTILASKELAITPNEKRNLEIAAAADLLSCRHCFCNDIIVLQ